MSASSPIVRGLASACAGEPVQSKRKKRIARGLSPRVRGSLAETNRSPLSSDDGLSPRVRGSLQGKGGVSGRLGSIPACAGEPSRQRCRLRQTGVYPRVCGGAHTLPTLDSQLEGLSPRVRGSHPLNRYVEILQGSIPACAGEPTSVGRTIVDMVCDGLSPRVRGARTASGSRYPVPGLSPTCEGEPQSPP